MMDTCSIHSNGAVKFANDQKKTKNNNNNLNKNNPQDNKITLKKLSPAIFGGVLVIGSIAYLKGKTFNIKKNGSNNVIKKFKKNFFPTSKHQLLSTQYKLAPIESNPKKVQSANIILKKEDLIFQQKRPEVLPEKIADLSAAPSTDPKTVQTSKSAATIGSESAGAINTVESIMSEKQTDIDKLIADSLRTIEKEKEAAQNCSNAQNLVKKAKVLYEKNKDIIPLPSAEEFNKGIETIKDKITDKVDYGQIDPSSLEGINKLNFVQDDRYSFINSQALNQAGTQTGEKQVLTRKKQNNNAKNDNEK